MDFECYKSLPDKFREIELIAEAADSVLVETNEHGRIQGNAMTRAALVLLCGYFEGFVREVAEEYLDIIDDIGLPLDSFPEPLYCAVVGEMVEGLGRANGNKVDGFKLVVRGNGKHAVNKKRLSSTGGNPTVDNIEAMFHILGLPKVIDYLSIKDYGLDSTFVSESQVLPRMRDDIHGIIEKKFSGASLDVVSDLVELIEKKWLPKQKRRKVGYVFDIEQLLKKRNRIAHGEGHEQITTTELRDTLEKVRNLSGGLHSLLVGLLADVSKK